MFRPKHWGAGHLIAMRDTFNATTPFCQKSLLGLLPHPQARVKVLGTRLVQDTVN